MVKKLKDANAPKRAMSAYFLWLNGGGRKNIVKQHPSWGIGEIGKFAGQQWGGMSDSQKAKFQKQATKDKAKYQKVLAKYKKSKNFARFQEEKKAFNKKKKMLSIQEPDGKPRRPQSGFMRFMADERPKIMRGDFNGVAEIGKEGGKRWGVLDEKKKAKYNGVANREMQVYKEEMAEWKDTEEYAEFLEEKKAATKAFKAEEKEAKRKAKSEAGGPTKKKRKTKSKKKGKKGRRGRK